MSFIDIIQTVGIITLALLSSFTNVSLSRAMSQIRDLARITARNSEAIGTLGTVVRDSLRRNP